MFCANCLVIVKNVVLHEEFWQGWLDVQMCDILNCDPYRAVYMCCLKNQLNLFCSWHCLPLWVKLYRHKSEAITIAEEERVSLCEVLEMMKINFILYGNMPPLQKLAELLPHADRSLMQLNRAELFPALKMSENVFGVPISNKLHKFTKGQAEVSPSEVWKVIIKKTLFTMKT